MIVAESGGILANSIKNMDSCGLGIDSVKEKCQKDSFAKSCFYFDIAGGWL